MTDGLEVWLDAAAGLVADAVELETIVLDCPAGFIVADVPVVPFGFCACVSPVA